MIKNRKTDMVGREGAPFVDVSDCNLNKSRKSEGKLSLIDNKATSNALPAPVSGEKRVVISRQIPELDGPSVSRFWRKVDKGSPDECWNWQGALGMGYGRFKINGVLYSPHRVSYSLAHGQIPDGEGYHGQVVMHTCDNRACCNPAHLVLGTQKDNVEDMDAKGRGNRIGPVVKFHPTDEERQLIINSPLSAHQLSKKTGWHRKWINRVRSEAGIDNQSFKSAMWATRRGDAA